MSLTLERVIMELTIESEKVVPMSIFTIIRKGDYVVFTFICVLIVSLFFLSKTSFAVGEGGTITVEVENEVVMDIPMGETGEEPQHITVPLEAGDATIEISEGKVRVLPMPQETCPLGICSQVGWIERAGEAIVCLPNRMVVTLHSEEEDPHDLDGVTK